jgi:hypothetical protein
LTTGELVPRAGGEAKRVNDRFVADLRRGSRDVWRIERLEWRPER